MWTYSVDTTLAASAAALQFGSLPWRLRGIQQSLWSAKVKDIQEVDGCIEEVTKQLRALSGRLSRQGRADIKTVCKQIVNRHRQVSKQNLDYFFCLVDSGSTQNRAARYHEYLTDNSNLLFLQWQKEDCNRLRHALKQAVKGDNRLEGYFQIGDRLGETIDRVLCGTVSCPISEKEWHRIVAGVGKLPLREQSLIHPYLALDKLNQLAGLVRQYERLVRFLKMKEQELTAKPSWSGKTISYLGVTEDIKLQKNGMLGPFFDAMQKKGWPDCLPLSRLPSRLHKRAVTNAITYFHSRYTLLEFAVNSDRLFWGPPGTVAKARRAKASSA